MSETQVAAVAPAAVGVGLVPLEASLRAARDGGRKLLVPYVTGGLGSHWVEVLQAMVANGADAVEIGIPFSDPVMDGPTIQEASLRALQLGATPPGILSELRRVRVEVPLIAMTYYNLVFRGGHRRFAHNLIEAGVAGIILPDVPLEELGDWSRAADEAGVETVLLAAPITPDDRMAELCRRSRGFVYGVNLMGVTGERSAVASSARRLAERLKAATDKPVLMGFGVSTPEQAAEAASYADGVIVASALMRLLLDGATPERVGDRVADLRAALDAT
ncbi:MAG: tryptophan synthase alpha chain [Acidimicrobiaceae bacterium]|jgi:tryptophan synthase alpha chain|nr:tryptophan synthase alpha chain [Acidimicrobiaceae bacterium]MDQ1401086.1 tryptophan synthase alpha chain [Acidimicrobiaceae bacterium]MDQ1414360.1 tryptophan synthase alpha chain [Acidimicrobiaceae bacterium]MDQ1416110.1 tryptophan synthase alpha chain [Acidimicrobiaceae bacterium]MDQ1419055.1 tryptophan synthase alpha chain [Acidimicrobiaceae bacterium]